MANIDITKIDSTIQPWDPWKVKDINLADEFKVTNEPSVKESLPYQNYVVEKKDRKIDDGGYSDVESGADGKGSNSYLLPGDDPSSPRNFDTTVSKEVSDPTPENPNNKKIVQVNEFANSIKTGDTRYFEPLLNANGLRKRTDINYFTQRYRFGIMDPYHQLQHAREYLFFTKPDLNIYQRNEDGTVRDEMNEYLQTQPEWMEFDAHHKDVLRCLQASMREDNGVYNPFNNLLGNMVSNNLEIPGLSSDTIETANSMYGVNVQYHGSSEASNDNFDFTLEFRDVKSLPVYTFFKAYEDYHTLSHHGVIKPWINYVWYHVLYDQYSIYKFVVDEDAETIVYYGKYYGVFSKSLPRDIFTNTDFSDGINYTVDFHAFSYRDMNPLILKEFNAVGNDLWDSLGNAYNLDVWNEKLDRVDNRPGKAARVFWEQHDIYGKVMPKLRWRGDAQY